MRPFALAACVMASFCAALAGDARAAAPAGYEWRTGGEFAVGERPRDGAGTACSFRAPLCVHAVDGTPADALLGALADLERARAALVGALGLPAPLDDAPLGGTGAFDLYLVAHAPDDGVEALADAPRPGRFDAASAFATLDRATRGCARKNLVARAYAEAIGLRLDPAESRAIRASRAAYLAEIVAPCAAVTMPLVDAAQRRPERAIFPTAGDAPAASGLLFPWYLDATLGAGRPGTLPFALTAASPQASPASALAWTDEPDLFDALRTTLKARTPPETLSDVLLDFAVARAFVGARDDGAHLAETAAMGDFGRVRFEWSVPFASLPRRLAPKTPIEPTGATYVFVDLTGAPKGAHLSLRAEWEPPVPFRWAIVRVRDDGTEASRVVVAQQRGATSAERNVEALDGLAGLLVVGTNAGDLDVDHPFDPDEWPAEPHGYVLTLSAE